jgi:hypothetical protein
LMCGFDFNDQEEYILLFLQNSILA